MVKDELLRDNKDHEKVLNKEGDLLVQESDPLFYNEEEALDLIQRLEKGPSEQSKEYIEESLVFYEEMEKKAESYK